MFIHYVASKFGPHWGSRLSNAPHSAKGFICADRTDLAWAAFSAGKADVSSLGAHGYSSFLDALGQMCTVLSITEADPHFIVKSSLQLAQEKTELAYSSNKTGNAFAKLVSAQLFGVAWLIHTSLLSKKMGMTFWKQRSPDFVGLTTTGSWVIVEAKGTSGSYDQRTVTGGKEQTRSLRMINGSFPVLRAVTLSHYWGDTLVGAIEDPEHYDDDAIDLEFDVVAVIKQYYESLTPPYTRPETINLAGRSYSLYINAIPQYDLALPSVAAIEAEMVAGDAGWKTETEGFAIYPDGVALRPRTNDG